MKKYTPAQLIGLLGAPAATVALGLVLLFSPDLAAAVASSLLGWILLLAALAEGWSAWSGKKKFPVRPVIFAILGLCFLLKPLSPAKILGRVIGLALFGWGVNSIRMNRRGTVTMGLVAAGAVTVLGLALFLLPMEATRLLLNLAGIVIIGIGIAEGADRLRGHALLEQGDDPNIIDVEKL